MNSNYDQVAQAIRSILKQPKWDDGSIGPLLVRLAWHASGTYDRYTNTGGSDGATMRFAPESSDSANAGLENARKFLEPIKAKFPWISYSDLWTLAGAVAIEAMGGPRIPWSPGRKDKPATCSASEIPPNGRLPDASQGAQHVRDVFYRMGFNDREITALVGAHALGRCHTDRSGYDGPWTYTPTRFSNQYFKLLLNNEWKPKSWNGPAQFVSEDNELMMLPADMVFKTDPEFRKYSEIYAKDKDVFFKDFAAAFGKLLALGVKNKSKL